VDELTSEETERGKRLHEKNRRGGKPSICQQAGEAIKEREIICLGPTLLTLESKCMGEASPCAAPDPPKSDVNS
jgi:hypothetical protein